MEKTEPIDPMQRPVPMSLLLMAAIGVHLPLLLIELPLKSSNANFHIFLASHYSQHWFNPWNPNWYAGFSQTTFPPLTQQWVALISPVLGIDLAYMAVQLAAIVLLVVGVYRFSLLWASRRAASLAALASVFVGSEILLVYSAGQLGTTCAACIYLNAVPFLYDWVRRGNPRALIKATVLFTAAAAAHHTTFLFGTIFFAVPVLALALLDRVDGDPLPGAKFIGRTITIALFAGAAITVVLLPFWTALIHSPVAQTSIPHPGEANYILTPNSGLDYFIVPYGFLILAVPFVFVHGSRNPRLRPLLFGFWIAFLLGLGGTTPVGRILLGRAFEGITIESFSYWATLLALPFAGILTARLIRNYRLAAAGGLTVLALLSCGFAVAWSEYEPANAADFKVDQVASWLNRDGHDQYRYFTLGFGNKISRLAMLTDAGSVDGEWNSGRTLPELTRYGGGPLTDSKYYGTPGLSALRAMLLDADRYGLKWVFVRDHYYDPLMSFAGWRSVDSLENNTIAIWTKDGVPPAQPVNAPQMPPRWQGLMWGILPFGSSILAILVLLIPEKRNQRVEAEYPVPTERGLAARRLAS